MSRLKAMLHVAPPSPCNTQQTLTQAVSDDSGRVSQELLHVAPPSPCNTQQTPLHSCTPVAQYTHTPQQAEGGAEGWREFESLLAIVGPAYKVTEAEYELIREAANRDLENALYSYREMAEQIERSR